MSEFSTREENNQKMRFKKYIWFQFRRQADIVFRFHFFLFFYDSIIYLSVRRLYFPSFYADTAYSISLHGTNGN